MSKINPNHNVKIKSRLSGKRIKASGLIPVFLFLLNTLLLSQSTDTASTETDFGSGLKTATIIFGVIVLVVLWYILVYATKPEVPASDKAPFSLWAFVKEKLTQAAPIEKEGEILMEDNFDGIRELNNKVPPWFNILFYGTIVIGVIYFFNFHVFSSNKLMLDEYNEEVQAADLQKEILNRSGKLVTEATVTLLTDPGSIQSGKEIFSSKCAVCHGKDGEGLVGPNLTDDFWIHGSGIKNIFSVIKVGVPAKGMITWQNQLSPRQIQEVASYVITLHGTNPPNAKAPQGIKTAAITDSTSTIM